MRNRAGNRRRRIGSLLVVLAGGIVAGEAAESRLQGRVADPGGLGIGQATVFLTAVSRSLPPGASALFATASLAASPEVLALQTSEDGTFSLALPPGRYRVVALKPGFEASMTEVSTLVRGVLEMRLREATRIILGDLPAGLPNHEPGLGWILRGEPDDILRDEKGRLPLAVEPEGEASGPGTAVAGAGGAAVPAARNGWLQAILQPLDGEFVQHFSGGDLLGDGAGGSGDTSGRSTALALHGAIGDQGSWRFDGLTGRLVTGAGDGASGFRQGRRADRMQVGFDYRIGPDDNLKADLRYGTSRYIVDANGETVNATDEEQSNLGLRSRWDRSFGNGALLYVGGAYFETGVTTPNGVSSPFATVSGDETGLRRVVDRSGLATAGLAWGSGDHRLSFGVRAKSYLYELRDRGVLLYSLDDAPTLTEPGERGKAISLFGSDDWRVAQRAVFTYGLGYHSNLSVGSAYVVPRIGLTLGPPDGGGTRIRTVILGRLDDPALATGGGIDRRDVGRVGYIVGVERKDDDGLQVAATLSYKPFEEGVGEEEGSVLAPGAWGDALIFLTDGAAGRREAGVEVARAFGPFHASLSGSAGRVDGRLTPAVEEAPVQILSLGEVRYYLTRVRAQYGPTETEVQIDYRHVQAEGGADAPADASADLDYRRLDLTVSQDLPRLRGLMNARFRVLMAYQGLAYGASYERAGSAPGVAARVTGGVDIRF